MDEIFLNIDGFEEAINYFRGDIVQKTAIRSSKIEAKRFVTGSVKDVRKEYNIKAKDLKTHIHINKADRYDMATLIKIESKRLSLSMFAPKIRRIRTDNGYREGVSVKVKKRERRKIVKGAFLFDNTIYMRETKARYPLGVVNTLSIPQMFNEDIINRSKRRFEENYPKTFSHNLNYYLSKT